MSSFAQQGINYKALIKDDLGNIVANQNVTIRFTIVDALSGGNIENQETHDDVMTDPNGIVIANIGEGAQSLSYGFFNDIDWGNHAHYLRMEIDITGGTNFVDMGTTQFMAVPYALHALNSSNDYWSKEENTTYNLDDRIGIGSDTLAAKLGVLHDGDFNDPHLYLYENGYGYATIKMGNSSSASSWYINAFLTSSEIGTNDELSIYNDRTDKNIMRLHSNGNVAFGVPIFGQRVNFHVGKDKSVLFGELPTLAGTKLMWLPDISAFRVGTIDEGYAERYWDRDSIGQYSFASGKNTRAQGFGATAMGRDTEAVGNYAMATGYYTTASGEYSTAMGNHTEAESYNSNAIGRFNVGGFINNTGTDNDGDITWVETDPLFEIGNGSGESNRSNALTVLKNGKVGIGRHIPSSLFEVAHQNGTPTSADRTNAFSIRNLGTGRSWQFYTHPTGYLELFNDGIHRGSFNPSSGVYATVSDRRLKKDITALDNGTLNKVMQLNPVSYLMKDQTDTNRNLGLISQEVQELFPSLTHYVKELDLLTLSYTELIPILIKALQEQQSIIDEQNKKIERLSADNSSLKNTVNNLISRVEKIETNNQ
jgi:hypothetical protein